MSHPGFGSPDSGASITGDVFATAHPATRGKPTPRP
jgi:hypothetical protein